jgi:hypothetical protein
MAQPDLSGTAAYKMRGIVAQKNGEAAAAPPPLPASAAGVGLIPAAPLGPPGAGTGLVPGSTLSTVPRSLPEPDDVLAPPPKAGIATIKVSSKAAPPSLPTGSTPSPPSLPTGSTPSPPTSGIPEDELIPKKEVIGLSGFRQEFSGKEGKFFKGQTFTFPAWSTSTDIYIEYIKPHLETVFSSKPKPVTEPKSSETEVNVEETEDDEDLNNFLDEAKADEEIKGLYDRFYNGTEIDKIAIKVDLATFLSDFMVKYHKENPSEKYDSQTFLAYIANTATPKYIKETVKYPEEITKMKTKTKEQKEEKKQRQEEHKIALVRFVMFLRNGLPQELIKGGYDE